MRFKMADRSLTTFRHYQTTSRDGQASPRERRITIRCTRHSLDELGARVCRPHSSCPSDQGGGRLVPTGDKRCKLDETHRAESASERTIRYTARLLACSLEFDDFPFEAGSKLVLLELQVVV
jgi:hypothetical protein